MSRVSLSVGLLLLSALAASAAPTGTESATKVALLIDTDIGDDIDDALVLALALSSPELDVRGVTTVHGDAHTRALLVCRTPDGSSGPLADNERIGDLQFYTDAAADLLIDDIVLYDAAPAGEKRPFAKRLLFTAWFDAGRQGKEWPGSFDIVAKKPPQAGKAARSATDPESGDPWIRLHLRGERPVSDSTRVRFRYQLTGFGSVGSSAIPARCRRPRPISSSPGRWSRWGIRRWIGPQSRCKLSIFLRLAAPRSTCSCSS